MGSPVTPLMDIWRIECIDLINHTDTKGNAPILGSFDVQKSVCLLSEACR